ncbi:MULTISPECIES: nuclear transport factor 2 family protein [Caulobacter]|jgi:uncharacterized protein (TIGR02246 family)|uniref:nuclear transport factor 2 family protein n=1 Tax=Caulobacter TaxID=75 RepID=UPI00078563C7|nr:MULTISPECIES: nuclear transport factor 2 family protein [Caulobacter]ATC24375.1 DUF4440 domain-containing protein [Caulobacter vibrioides]MBQ1561716.1 nuclear transport factor 2 family protein [Caulobacter sp.]MCK5909029.1 nuclear transport factor 2 family protein [Caulobacter sp.]PIB97088.1 DUF4440 domain-containing protein [Caulobacter sp. X]
MKSMFLAASLAAAFALPTSAGAQTRDPSAEVRAVVDQFTQALSQKDAARMGPLFSKDSIVIEGGRLEGSFETYLHHHLGPELAEFDSFTVKDRKVSVRQAGDVAWAYETYGYEVRLKGKPMPLSRLGATTAVLVKTDGAWRIVQLHISSKAPPAKK